MRNAFEGVISAQDIRNAKDFRQALVLATSAKGLSFNKLALEMEYQPKQIYNVMDGKSQISPRFCFALEDAIGIEAKFWWDLYWDTYIKRES